MAEASFEQARKTFEKFLSGAQATAGTHGGAQRDGSGSGAREVSAKAVVLCREERAGFPRLCPVAARRPRTSPR